MARWLTLGAVVFFGGCLCGCATTHSIYPPKDADHAWIETTLSVPGLVLEVPGSFTFRLGSTASLTVYHPTYLLGEANGAGAD